MIGYVPVGTQTAFGSSADALLMRSTLRRGAQGDSNTPTKPLKSPYLSRSSARISKQPIEPTRLRPQRRASRQTAPNLMGSHSQRPRGMTARGLAQVPRRVPKKPL